MWNDIELVETVSRGATWMAALLGFLAGIAGIIAIAADNRTKVLANEQKKTPPILNVTIQKSDDNQFYVTVDSKTLIPFECQWVLVTRNNNVLAGVPLEWAKAYPTHEKHYYKHREDIDLSKVIDDYIELRFDYRSIYSAEMNIPSLQGRIICKYKLSDDRRSVIPIEN